MFQAGSEGAWLISDMARLVANYGYATTAMVSIFFTV
jgi:hypothetical protein